MPFKEKQKPLPNKAGRGKSRVERALNQFSIIELYIIQENIIKGVLIV